MMRNFDFDWVLFISTVVFILNFIMLIHHLKRCNKWIALVLLINMAMVITAFIVRSARYL